MITYTVPTPHGVQTRKSASHTLAGQRYRYLACHTLARDTEWTHYGDMSRRVAKAGTFYGCTWHSTRELAQRSTSPHAGYGWSMHVEVIEITDAMCREAVKRGATPAQLAAVERGKAKRRADWAAKVASWFPKSEEA